MIWPFIYTAPEERLRRLKTREYETFGDAMLPGGGMYDHVQDFLEFAASYDTADITASGRSLKKHEVWFDRLTCPLLKLDGAVPLEQLLSQAMAAIKN